MHLLGGHDEPERRRLHLQTTSESVSRRGAWPESAHAATPRRHERVNSHGRSRARALAGELTASALALRLNSLVLSAERPV